MYPEFSRSVWTESAGVPRAPALRENEIADVCVVGAGISGLTTAYCLAREGWSVVVVDDGAVAGGETSRTTAHVVNVLDEYYHEIERLRGENAARLAADSHSAAIDVIESIARASDIDCEFQRVDGYLACKDDLDLVSNELIAARNAGLTVEEVRRVPLDFYDFGMALRFANQAQIHPLKYIRGLTTRLLSHGVRIYSGVHVDEVEEEGSVVARTDRGMTIEARAAVIAASTPMINRVAIHTKQAAYRTYALAARIPSNSVPPLLLWDAENPYHYVRTQRGNGASGNGYDWLIVGGEDHKTGQPANNHDPFDALERWMRKRFPMAQDVSFKWSGQIMEPFDGLAFIGRNPGNDNVYVVTGDSGNGMTHGTLAGLLITDLIAGRSNPWAELYDPSRKPLRAANSYVAENLNTVARYREHFRTNGNGSVARLARGQGAVLRNGARKLAVYRDDTGGLHRMTAICPHLGCIVEWNGIERSWDCPCHGSRFDPLDGHVLHGPATHGLQIWREK